MVNSNDIFGSNYLMVSSDNIWFIMIDMVMIFGYFLVVCDIAIEIMWFHLDDMG